MRQTGNAGDACKATRNCTGLIVAEQPFADLVKERFGALQKQHDAAVAKAASPKVSH